MQSPESNLRAAAAMPGFGGLRKQACASRLFEFLKQLGIEPNFRCYAFFNYFEVSTINPYRQVSRAKTQRVDELSGRSSRSAKVGPRKLRSEAHSCIPRYLKWVWLEIQQIVLKCRNRSPSHGRRGSAFQFISPPFNGSTGNVKEDLFCCFCLDLGFGTPRRPGVVGSLDQLLIELRSSC